MKKFVILIVILFLFLVIFANMKNDIIDNLNAKHIPHWLVVVFISSLPIFELRGGIPIAINVFDMNIYYSYILCIIGNLIPIIPILLFLEFLYKFFSKWRLTKKIFDKIYDHTASKSKQIEKYKFLGLILFVAIPLPVTGAWTGAIASVIFNIKFLHAFWGITIGVLIAGIIVTILSISGIYGALIAGIVLFALIIITIIKSFK